MFLKGELKRFFSKEKVKRFKDEECTTDNHGQTVAFEACTVTGVIM
jgi:hypothetical protein